MTVVCFVGVRVRLRAPAVITQPGGDPNSAASHDHIPGSVLRGAVAKRIQAAESDPAERELLIDDLILSGRVCYLPGYPEVDGQRSLPPPSSWQLSKAETRACSGDQGVEVFGVLRDVAAAATPGLEPMSGYLAQLPDGWRRVTTRMRDRIHHQRHRPSGRSGALVGNQLVGTPYAYEAIEAGQIFSSLLRLEADSEAGCADLAQRLRALLDMATLPLGLGRSRNAEYGGDPVIEVADFTTPTECAIAADPATDELAVMLTSPYVGRDPHTGAVDPAQLIPDLEALPPWRGRVSVKAVCGTTTIRRGYNARWGVPTPTSPVWAAGTTVLLELREAVTPTELTAAEQSGIGIQRIEGCGRWVVLPEMTPQRLEAAPLPTDRVRVRPPDRQPPEEIRAAQNRLLWQRSRQHLLGRAAVLAATMKERPPAARIGRLRQALRSGWSHARPMTAGLEAMAERLEEMRGSARRSLGPARIGAPPDDVVLEDWLAVGLAHRADDAAMMRWVGEKGDLWPTMQDCQLIAQAHEGWAQDHAQELAFVFLEALLASLLRRDQREESATATVGGADGRD